MSKIKFSFICAGGGLILSFTLGFLSGVAFWLLFVRAVFFGIFFGAFVYLAFYLLEKYLPELFIGDILNKDDKAIGKNLNITLDDAGDDLSNNKSISDAEIEERGFSKISINEQSLDELPNLSEFEVVGASLDDEETIDFVEEGASGLLRTKETDIDSVDADTIAKAIHTVLERES